MGASQGPPGEPRFEVSVHHEIGVVARKDFDIVDKTFARAHEEDLDMIRLERGAGMVQNSCRGDGGPRCSESLVAGGPMGRLCGIGADVQSFQTGSAAVGGFVPSTAAVVFDGFDGDVDEMGNGSSRVVRPDNPFGHAEGDAVVVERQIAGEISDEVGGMKIGKERGEVGGVLGHNEVAAGSQGEAAGEVEFNASFEPPIAEDDRGFARVVDFDEGFPAVPGQWVDWSSLAMSKTYSPVMGGRRNPRRRWPY